MAAIDGTMRTCDRAAGAHPDGKQPYEFVPFGASPKEKWHSIKHVDRNQVEREYMICDACYAKYESVQETWQRDFSEFITQQRL